MVWVEKEEVVAVGKDYVVTIVGRQEEKKEKKKYFGFFLRKQKLKI